MDTQDALTALMLFSLFSVLACFILSTVFVIIERSKFLEANNPNIDGSAWHILIQMNEYRTWFIERNLELRRRVDEELKLTKRLNDSRVRDALNFAQEHDADDPLINYYKDLLKG